MPDQSSWHPGDRVKVSLPDRSAVRGRGSRRRWFTGTVRELDQPGLPPGVRIDLDHPVNGVRDCYAAHDELHPIGDSW